MDSFKHLGLSTPILKVISELGFEKPSEIQERAVPELIQKDLDFIGLAQTGTGKTAAFGWPLLERVDTSNPTTQALILAPTRELGQQIAQQLEMFSRFQKRINILAVYGGAPITTQLRALRKPQHIIIATPGRLIDLIKRKAVFLDQLKFLVLDEADEMLNMGFKEDLDTILSYTPEEKLVWLFSATMSGEIKRIVKKYMDDPFEVRLNTKNEVNTNIEHQFVAVKQANKKAALCRFLDVTPNLRGVVFCRTRRETQELADMLQSKNYRTDALHGDLSQRLRDRVMQKFKNHELQVLIATDVAARGIDVDDLTHVFHFTLPDDVPYYTHRSGRTARAGKQGTSIAFINTHEKHRINRLQKALGITFQKIQVPDASEIHSRRMEDWCMEVLETKTKGKVAPEVLDMAMLLFGNLSKEELIAKALVLELDKLKIDTSKDLNEVYHKRSSNSSNKGSYKGNRSSFKRKPGGKRSNSKNRKTFDKRRKF